MDLRALPKNQGSLLSQKKHNGDIEDKENENDDSMRVKYPSYSIKLSHPKQMG